MHHDPPETLRVEDKFVSNGSLDGSTTLERKNTSSSDNDVTATMSTGSSSQGSFHVLTEPEAQENQETTPRCSPSRSPRRKSSLNKTDSMLRGSINAQDFFGAGRVFQEIDPKDNELSASKQGRVNNSEIAKKEAVGDDSSDRNTKVESTKIFVPGNTVQVQSEGEAISSPTAPVDARPRDVGDLVGRKCQCIIL
ncbi:hypothetical protein ACHAWO_008269 [Cyclotella atomus]|jgi:hypothetical protein|uniref:Uncharacterized protein n=1 Tax=Cyclotella atomus TaxID=382360 RepID=A0ABD3MRJ2_9STRA